VAAYVRSLSGQQLGEADQARLPAGQEVFAANCASCHGEEGKGMVEVGAPDLTDDNWIYGGDAQSVFTTIYSGRQGHMPHWQNRLSPTDIRILALYVGTLAEGDR
jgi:cytochrome c oxidase cbb3-type subunit 3